VFGLAGKSQINCCFIALSEKKPVSLLT